MSFRIATSLFALLITAACTADPCVALCEDAIERAWDCGASDPACYGSDSDMTECRDLCSDPEVTKFESRTRAECEAELTALDNLSCEEVLEEYED